MREISVNWNPSGAMRFEAAAPNGYTVIMDTIPQFGGNGEGMIPKDVLLSALGGCTGMDVISILRKMRQEVTGYRIQLRGEEHTEHPKKFDRIVVEHIIEGYKLNPEQVAKAVQLSHEKYCTIAASLAGSVEIEMTYQIIEAAPVPVLR